MNFEQIGPIQMLVVGFDKEADYLTAFATEDEGLIVIIEGNISQETEDKLVAMGAASGSLNRHGSGKTAFYHIKDDDDAVFNGNDITINGDSFDDGAYFSFALKNKLIVTSTREKMESLLASRGKVKGVRGERGQLFVLSAERGLIQAGASTADIGSNGNWDSNILRNTKQAALLVADKKGKISIEAQLITTEPEMAESLASIVRGLISLQVFDEDMDPEVAQFLTGTTVAVDGSSLNIRLALDPESVVVALDD